MSAIYADRSPYNVSANLGDNSAGLTAALAAAASGDRVLFLPAGDLKHSKDLLLPAGFQGPMVIAGLGDTISRLVPVAGNNGLVLDLSAGDPQQNSVEISELGFFSSASAGIPLKISYGSKGLGSVGSYPGSKLRDLCISGGGWTMGIILQECWNLSARTIRAYGTFENYLKTGPALTLLSGVNNRFTDLQFNFWNQGVIMGNDGRGAAGDCQGIYFDVLQMMECIEGVHAYGTPGGTLSTLVFKGWMADNGNVLHKGHRSMVFDNARAALIGVGAGLQDGGDSQIIFNNCHSCAIDPLVNLEYRANVTGPAVQDNNGANNDLGGQSTKLVNISTRGFVGTGANILIAGFVITGSTRKTVLIRASGPALSQFGVPGVLGDPKLTILSGSTVIGQIRGGGRIPRSRPWPPRLEPSRGRPPAARTRPWF